VEADIGSLVNDKIIHERARLLILTHLASSSARQVPFSAIREALDMTAGNLSIQLKTLAEAGYVAITKEFKDNKPLTRAALTAKGSSALKRYIDQMDLLIKGLRK
jgi:DNA-binding HxlR family transcriptional regulator